MRTPAARFEDIPGRLPEATIPDGTDRASVGETAISKLNNLKQDDLASFAIWRDLLSLTDTFRTFYSAEKVFSTLSRLRHDKQCSNFRLNSENEARRIDVLDTSWLEFDVTFTIKDGHLVGNGAGIVSVMLDGDHWKIWMLRTWLENYEGHGHPDDASATSNSVTNGHAEDVVYEAAIVGGGQSGLAVAGRLTALGIPNILFDSRPAIGDSWAHRYDSLKWHTIKEYGNMPLGRTFDEDDPDMVPVKRIASAYKAWATKHNLNIREGTSIDKAVWDSSSQTWSVTASTASSINTWKARNLVLAIGPGQTTPVSPSWASPSDIKSSGFRGTIIHSANYHNVNTFHSQHGVVIGTANTAHDIAEDMANAQMSVTMVQRSPTFIFPGEWLAKTQAKDYHRGQPNEIPDRRQLTNPLKISREMTNRNVHHLIKQNPKRFDDLEKAGFKVDRFGDLATNLQIRFGGHYIDTGSCQRIIDGEIKVKAVPVRGLTSEGLLFEDGTEVKADLIVLATGYNHDFRPDAAKIVGHDIAEQMDDYYGPDAEGELRGYARLAGHPKLYYAGGEVRTSRFFSRFVALQIQKEALGEPLRPYLEGRR
ncbi:putative flavin monooxygenase, FAD/NAD(P)-binding domain superfamily [Septoria linicola]|nr:putative flavin monooxygenase, FAD/NAD(P)-binding domain superfamily [Septoria linicola]